MLSVPTKSRSVHALTITLCRRFHEVSIDRTILRNNAHGAVNGSIRVEPGKQLPQSLKIHVDGKPAAGDVTMRYLVFTPKDYKSDGKKWPLMLFLHGLGECSKDDLSRVKIHGPAHLVESRPDFPFVVVTPQAPPPPVTRRALHTSRTRLLRSPRKHGTPRN